MKHLVKVAFATVLFFLCTSFKPAPDGTFPKKDENYYWYLDGGTVYDGWRSELQEITSLEERYDVYVDQDPVDGTLIASGYGIKGYPHSVYALIFLYSH